MARYRPTFRKQLDGTTCGGSQCNAATHAMEADAHQRGVNPRKTSAPWKPAPSRLYQRIKEVLTLSGCPATNNEMNETVLARDYGIALAARFNVPFEDHVTLVKAGRVAEVTILYKALRGTRYDSAPTFGGRHAVAHAETRSLSAGRVFGRSAAGTYHLIGDPMADGRWLYSIGRHALNGWQWWPDRMLRSATAAAGTVGLVDASDYTQDIEPGIRLHSDGVNMRTDPSLNPANVFAQTAADGIHRKSDGLLLAPATSSFAFLGFVSGTTVSGSNQWAKMRAFGKTLHVHTSLARVRRGT